MGIIHVVMFAFEPLAPAEDVQGVCDRMLALKDNCVHPQSKKPYVKMGMGGRDNSTEGHQGGITHVFISEFENEEDRQYYLKEDPAHLAFVKSISGIVAKAQVVDFTPGIF
ncbi:stress responsive A/B barrel domain protein [Cryphonectria parasitica EP155]|uniref:Stress responsive A/B barrel domain protein n=1 Tax=Cryphonectria parasitica (strain ATCC 38755 / EP155) TaxID=660469 RepID=A0A9P4XXF5_CRYP1|nr:stress responsive A/B barrel domain protein [Cryphonectria parasitica EP155]KAF3763117.1 stress responsive A/B barrel domain protein [Cryphonectria parasitica EP155]